MFALRKVPVMTPTETVDRIGALRAEIADLESEVKRLQSVLTETGLDSIVGSAFRASLVEQTRETLDRKGLEAQFGVAEIARFARASTFSFWRVTPLARAAAKGVKR